VMFKFLFNSESKTETTLSEYLKSLYSAPLTLISPIFAYFVLFFLKKHLSPAWKLIANCFLYLYSVLTTLYSFESMNLIPNSELSGTIGHFDRIVRIITRHINNNFTAEKVISTVWFLVVYRFVILGVFIIAITVYITYSSYKLMKKQPKVTSPTTTVNVYNHIPTINVTQHLPTHTGDPILTEEYLNICDAYINPNLPESEKKNIFGQNLSGKASKWFSDVKLRRNYQETSFNDLKSEFESLFTPFEDKNVVCYERLQKCKQYNNESVFDFANRFRYTASFSNIDPMVQYCLFKTNLREDIKSKLNEENFQCNIDSITNASRKIEHNLRKRAVLPTLRPRNKESKALTAQEKEELRKTGGCFYCRETGHILRNCPKIPNQGKEITQS
jgi:hypothetical protein